jgi:hypothetical protein
MAGKKRTPKPARDYGVRPANLAIYRAKIGRPLKHAGQVRVRTMVYLNDITAEWYAERALGETGKQKRRNDLIEGVLEDYMRSMIEGGIAICARHGEQGCYYCANPGEYYAPSGGGPGDGGREPTN